MAATTPRLGGAALLLATLTLFAVQFPAASASCSPPVHGVSPAASAPSITPLVFVTTDASASPSLSASASPPPASVRDDAARLWPSSPRTRSSSSASNATVGSAESVGSLGAATTTPTSTSSSTPLVVITTDASASPSPLVVAGLSADASASPSPPVVSACAASPTSTPPATVREVAPVWPSATPASGPSSPRTRSTTIGHPHSPTASSPPPATVCDAPPVCSSSPGIAMMGRPTTPTVDAQALRARSDESVESPRCGRSASASTTVTKLSPTASTSSSSSSSPGRALLILSVVTAILAAAGGWAARGGQQQRGATDDYCELCFVKKAVFMIECCEKPVCNLCLHDFLRESHDGSCKRLAAMKIVPLLHPHQLEIGDDLPAGYVHQPQYPPWYFVKAMKKNSRLHLFYYHLQDLERGADPRVTEVIHLVYPKGELSPAIVCDISPRMRTFSEL